MDNRYNNWTNYATWRVNLEIFDGVDPREMGWACLDHYDLKEAVKDYASELIEMDVREGLALDYARAFLSDVNWWEIAQHLIDDHELAEPDEETQGVLEHAAWYDTSAELE